MRWPVTLAKFAHFFVQQPYADVPVTDVALRLKDPSGTPNGVAVASHVPPRAFSVATAPAAAANTPFLYFVHVGFSFNFARAAAIAFGAKHPNRAPWIARHRFAHCLNNSVQPPVAGSTTSLLAAGSPALPSRVSSRVAKSSVLAVSIVARMIEKSRSTEHSPSSTEIYHRISLGKNRKGATRPLHSNAGLKTKDHTHGLLAAASGWPWPARPRERMLAPSVGGERTAKII